jgi:DNA invertase Pin-like site-specific DNA recombinase
MSPRRNKSISGPRRAVGVVRISKNRKDETSTATQEASIRAYCDAHGIDLIDVTEDKGRSAYKSNRTTRPGLRRARNLIDGGAADTLIAWKIDRVARNTRDLLNLVHDLTEHGNDFVSVTESFDTTTAMGRAMLTIIAALAELESAQKSERIAEWQDHRRVNKAPPTGPRPFGYDRVERTVQINGVEKIVRTLAINRAEARLIRKMARDVLAGKSIRAITAELNANSNGRRFTHRGVVRILTSPTIAALRPVDGTVIDWYATGQTGALVECDTWRPILDRDTWERVHRILLDPARRTNHSSGRRWLLSGLAECGKCGKPMQIKTSHPRGPRYQCPTGHLSIPAADTEHVVESVTLGSLDLKAWRRLRSRGRRVLDTTALEAELADLAERRFLPSDNEDHISAGEWTVLRRGIVSQLTDAAAAEAVALPKVDDPRKAWPSLDVEAKRLIVTAVLPRIVIGPAQPGLSSFDADRIVCHATA